MSSAIGAVPPTPTPVHRWSPPRLAPWTMRRLLRAHLGHHRRALAVAVVAIVAGAGLVAITPIAFRIAIDDGIVAAQRATLITAGLAVAGLTAAGRTARRRPPGGDGASPNNSSALRVGALAACSPPISKHVRVGRSGGDLQAHG